MEPGFMITVNGVAREVAPGPERSLLEVLREELGITGPKLGCGEGACGACTVLLGRRAVTACTTPAGEAGGHQVTTVEGLAEDGLLHPVQQAWLETGALQCGYCTPGWLAGCAALLARVPHPDDARIAEELRVPPGAVRVLMGHTGVSPFDLGTFGSRSMPDAAPLLRRAAAAARRVLRETAAQRFGLAEADLTVADGMAAGPDGAPSASFGELVTGMHRVEQARADEQVTRPGAWSRAGRPVRPTAVGAAVTGTKRFPSDLAVPGMRHGCVLRAPAYGARLLELDPAAAQAMPGVQVVRD